MKKKFLSLLTGALSAVVLFSFTACGGETSDSNPVEEPADSVAETQYDLVRDGRSDYIIVVPDEDSKMLNFAQSELALFFEEATVIELTVKRESEVSEGTKKYISLGETEQFDKSGFTVDYDELGRSGYIIKHQNESVFIAGASDYGTTFGVYEFLKYEFNYEYFYKDTYTLERNVRNKKLIDFDNKTVASIDQCYLAMGEVIDDEVHAHRMRTYTQEDVYLNLGASRWHSAFSIIGNMTADEKAKWVSPAGNQPCFTRDREGITTRMAENIMAALRLDKTATAVNIGQADNSQWCGCDECNAEREKYGTNSATFIKAVNMIADKVQAMLDEEQPGRNVTITFFAYLATLEPPVKQTEDGGWEPVSDEVKLRPNVSVLNAPISMLPYLHWSLEDGINNNARLAVEKWAAMGNEQYMWIYNNTFYSNYFTPVDSLNATQTTLQFLAEKGTRWIMQQGQQNNPVAPDWSRLKAYVDAKLAWNVNDSTADLTKAFLDAYFGPASAIMGEYLDDFRTWYTYTAELSQNSGLTETKTMQSSFFPRNILVRWLDYIEQAYESIGYLSDSDPEYYQKIYDRINLESLSPRYLQMYIYRSDFSSADLAEMEENIRKDCSRLGVMMKWEHAYIEESELF